MLFMIFNCVIAKEFSLSYKLRVGIYTIYIYYYHNSKSEIHKYKVADVLNFHTNDFFERRT